MEVLSAEKQALDDAEMAGDCTGGAVLSFTQEDPRH